MPSLKSCDLVDQEKARFSEGKLLNICNRGCILIRLGHLFPPKKKELIMMMMLLV